LVAAAFRRTPVRGAVDRDRFPRPREGSRREEVIEGGAGSLAGRIFYRYVGDGEVRAIEETGMLRGGRGAGEEATYWTDERYDSSEEAQRRLSLRSAPDARVAFRIKNEPDLMLEGAEVEPDGFNPGAAGSG